jgi:hypothetical protein
MTSTNSINGSANNEDMADGKKTPTNLQKPLVNDQHGQVSQMVLTL